MVGQSCMEGCDLDGVPASIGGYNELRCFVACESSKKPFGASDLESSCFSMEGFDVDGNFVLEGGELSSFFQSCG